MSRLALADIPNKKKYIHLAFADVLLCLILYMYVIRILSTNLDLQPLNAQRECDELHVCNMSLSSPATKQRNIFVSLCICFFFQFGLPNHIFFFLHWKADCRKNVNAEYVKLRWIIRFGLIDIIHLNVTLHELLVWFYTI